MRLDVSHLNLWFEAKNGYGTGGGRLYLRLSSPWLVRSTAFGRSCVGGVEIFARTSADGAPCASPIAGTCCCAGLRVLPPTFRTVPNSIPDR